MTLLGQQPQLLGGWYGSREPLEPAEDDDREFMPYETRESDPPPAHAKKMDVLGVRRPLGSYRLGGFVKR